MIPIKKILYLILLFSLCFGAESKRKSYDILRLDEDVNIDGFLDESIWSQGAPMTNFILHDFTEFQSTRDVPC